MIGKYPLVTIYIVNHNYEKYLEESIQSCVDQTFKDFEVLIINNSPCHESEKIIGKYLNLDYVRTFIGIDTSLISAANLALRESRGKYIMRLDADDFLHADALLVMTAEIQKEQQTKIVFPDYFNVDSEGNILSIMQRIDFQDDDILKDLVAHGACTLFEKEALLDKGGYDSDLECQDGFDLWMKVALDNQVRNVNLPLFYYRQHPESLSTNPNRLLEARISVLTKRQNQKNDTESGSTVAILPNLGKFGVNNFCNETLGDRLLVFRCIDQLLLSKHVDSIVFSTPDTELADTVRGEFGETVDIHLRAFGGQLVGDHSLTECLRQCIQEIGYGDYKNAFIANAHSPFIDNKHIDAAILVFKQFNVDYVIAVKQVTENHYVHRGLGMESIGNNSYLSSVDKEFERFYKQIPGVFALSIDRLMESKNLLDGTVGHILVDDQAASTIKTPFDLKIAKMILDQGAG